jgi:hypothetical protein
MRNSIERKLPVYEKSFVGLDVGRPMAVPYA